MQHDHRFSALLSLTAKSSLFDLSQSIAHSCVDNLTIDAELVSPTSPRNCFACRSILSVITVLFSNTLNCIQCICLSSSPDQSTHIRKKRRPQHWESVQILRIYSTNHCETLPRTGLNLSGIRCLTRQNSTRTILVQGHLDLFDNKTISSGTCPSV